MGKIGGPLKDTDIKFEWNQSQKWVCETEPMLQHNCGIVERGGQSHSDFLYCWLSNTALCFWLDHGAAQKRWSPSKNAAKVSHDSDFSLAISRKQSNIHGE